MASYYGNGKRARGRATTCPCEKTIRARGEDSLSLGTHDAQTSCLLPKLSQIGIVLKVGMGGFICVPCAYSLIPQTTESLGFYTCLHWRQSRTPGSLTLVSVTTKHTSLHWACNRHLPMVGLPNATGQAGKPKPGDFFHLRQGLLPDHSGMEGVSSRIIFESSGSLKQEQRPFFDFWYLYCGNYYLNGSPALRSFIYVDVGEPTSHPTITSRP